MIKLIVSDMDGTLLNNEHKIDPAFYDLLPKLKEEGIRFVVASGRQYPSLRTDFLAYLEDVVIIAENGAFVVDNEKELVVEKMSDEEIHHCVEEIMKLEGAEALVCAKYCSYTRSPELFGFLSSPQFRYEMRLEKDLYSISDDIIKVSVIEYAGKGAEDCYRRLRPALCEDLNLVVSGNGCLDTGIRGVNKGTAVAALQKMWNICPEETMVFGDQFNDVEMFEQAEYSFAMANAADGVKKYAKYIAAGNNDNGVVKAIREITGL